MMVFYVDEDSDGDVYEPVEPFPLMQTPAAPPSTNVWEERAKKHQLQQVRDQKYLNFIHKKISKFIRKKIYLLQLSFQLLKIKNEP